MPERDDEGTVASGISRRGFLKGLGAGTIAVPAAGLLGQRDAEAQEAAAEPAGGPKVLKGEFEITLRINGEAKKVRVEPRTTLLSALRDRLDLTGSKLVCDRGTCGACSVFLDDKLVTSCMVLAIDAQGREITTIEGLGKDGKLDPVQAAFIEDDALQCGFCTPGFVMACKAALNQNPAATAEELREAISGNICRCGTYDHIFAAVARVQKQATGGTA